MEAKIAFISIAAPSFSSSFSLFLPPFLPPPPRLCKFLAFPRSFVPLPPPFAAPFSSRYDLRYYFIHATVLLLRIMLVFSDLLPVLSVSCWFFVFPFGLIVFVVLCVFSILALSSCFGQSSSSELLKNSQLEVLVRLVQIHEADSLNSLN